MQRSGGSLLSRLPAGDIIVSSNPSSGLPEHHECGALFIMSESGDRNQSDCITSLPKERGYSPSFSGGFERKTDGMQCLQVRDYPQTTI